jgi:hypothetical protein
MTGQRELKDRIQLINSNLYFDPKINFTNLLSMLYLASKKTKMFKSPQLKEFYSYSKFIKLLS